MTTNTAEVQSEEASIPQYGLDPQWLEQNGRSLRDMALLRLCPKSQKKFKGDKGSLDPLAETGTCCATAPSYFSTNLPLLEAIFRLFLSNDNQPLNLVDIGEALMAKRIGVESPRDLSVRTLQRMLDKDTYYGIRRVGAPAEQPTESSQAATPSTPPSEPSS